MTDEEKAQVVLQHVQGWRVGDKVRRRFQHLSQLLDYERFGDGEVIFVGLNKLVEVRWSLNGLHYQALYLPDQLVRVPK